MPGPTVSAPRIDPTLVYLQLVQAALPKSVVVLDVGCGRGYQAEYQSTETRALLHWRIPGRTVIGIDVDAAAAQNPLMDEVRLIGGDGRWPVASSSVDAVFSDWVLEHVADPHQFCLELSRVLKPGGVFVARTVNKASGPALVARAIPNRLHARIVRVLQPGRQAADVFPTMYRMNSHRDLERHLKQAGLLPQIQAYAGSHGYFASRPRLARIVNSLEGRLPERALHTLIVRAEMARATA